MERRGERTFQVDSMKDGTEREKYDCMNSVWMESKVCERM